MHFSFGVYAQILKKCKGTDVTQLMLGRRLLSVLNEDASSLYSDSGISDLFNGKKNLNREEVVIAKDLDSEVAIEKFRNAVVPCLDARGLNVAAQAVKRAIAADETIGNDIVIDMAEGITKNDALTEKNLDPVCFLAGVFPVCLFFSAQSRHERFVQADRRCFPAGER